MKKYLAALLVFLFVLSPASVFAADSFTLSLSAKEVLRGEDIVLSGTASEGISNIVIKMVRPDQTVLYMDVLFPSAGSYSARVTLPAAEDAAPYGVYTVIAGSGTVKQTGTFSVVGKLGAEPTPTVAPTAAPTATATAKPTASPSAAPTATPAPAPSYEPAATDTPSSTPAPAGIPVDAGQAGGSTIQPEPGPNGQLWLGSETMSEAIRQNAGLVTVELPASAAQAGTALELPGVSLEELWNQKQDLRITSGNLTMLYPAGSITASTGQESRIRITLNTALTGEASTMVAESLRLSSGYTATGVVLSAVLEDVAGGKTTEIHKMNKPVQVSLRLAPERISSIAADLAGAYYVDGQRIEYAGGSIVDGTLNFKASHFSYYTVLQYKKVFADLTGHWAENPVQSLAAKHIATGVDEQHYEPARSITRAEFVSLIMRSMEWADKATASAAANPFSDVAAGKYYTQQVAAAAQMEIISGYGGKFRPADPITREEAVTALVRAAEHFSLAGTVQAKPDFADSRVISSWALPAVQEAWTLGLIQGDGSRFRPQDPVTRAEVAVMINRLLQDGTL
ncbi:S-layer homology domain-containing protein [Paenibacillus sp. S150]|uniref:S-layer homology domain-containing protein n=1 Tax=Paenibacillus sp. S150 TaxID=2749826 RepID=UPI001C565714|nr:S-layer homology domain-containing protein [Paenibacillus sp. S150]MBW4084480.1 S-layer homology domain-containing protein [Paenibacillus sp. S150]